jgi:hypothetical protein
MWKLTLKVLHAMPLPMLGFRYLGTSTQKNKRIPVAYCWNGKGFLGDD